MKKGYLYRLVISRLVPFLSRHPLLVFSIWLIYLVAPVDLIPEALTGPLGYLDDLLVLMASLFISQKFQKRTQTHQTSSSSFSSKDPYEILEIKRGSPPEEVKKAYRKKMAEYHPDKVAHLGEELKKTALEKTREIQEAYESLTK